MPTTGSPPQGTVRTRYGFSLPNSYLGRKPEPDRHLVTPSRLGLIGIALLALAGLLAAFLLTHFSFADSQLTGARGPACVRLVIAADVSGSMTKLAQPRDAAVAQLLIWAPKNLRADDEMAVVVFAGSAVTTVPPAPIGSTQQQSEGAPDPFDTRLQPLLLTIGQFPRTRCRTTLLLISDAQFSDLPADPNTANQQMAEASVDRVDLLVPGSIDVNPDWSSLYLAAPPDRFDGNDPDETALAIARHIAASTGQKLTSVKASERWADQS
jgi:hypothetical protein